MSKATKLSNQYQQAESEDEKVEVVVKVQLEILATMEAILHELNFMNL